MKTIFLSLLFAVSTVLSVQAQDELRIIVNNNTSTPWVYKLADASHGSLVSQSFGPNSSTEFVIAPNAYQFPFTWGAQDAGGCYGRGTFNAPSGPTEFPFHCTNAVLNQAFAASSNGVLYLFVTMK